MPFALSVSHTFTFAFAFALALAFAFAFAIHLQGGFGVDDVQSGIVEEVVCLPGRCVADLESAS